MRTWRTARSTGCGAAAVLLVAAFAACGSSGGSSGPSTGAGSAAASTSGPAAGTTTATVARPAPPPPPPYPVVLPAAQRSLGSQFKPVVSLRGQSAAWMARLPSGVTLLYFDQRLLTLALHSGTIDAGASGWHYGPSIVDGERGRLVAAFNGGFKLDTGVGGFQSYGRTAVPLRPGLGSIVTYADGTTNVGAWQEGVPGHSSPVVSVRQNLSLLIDHGHAAGNVECVSCWGATLGGGSEVARSALGVTTAGQLVWAGGEGLSVSALADALLKATAVRAVELDINPQWVAGYLYRHRGSGKPLQSIPVVPAQHGVSGEFLEAYARDFFTVLAR